MRVILGMQEIEYMHYESIISRTHFKFRRSFALVLSDDIAFYVENIS